MIRATQAELRDNLAQRGAPLVVRIKKVDVRCAKKSQPGRMTRLATVEEEAGSVLAGWGSWATDRHSLGQTPGHPIYSMSMRICL